MILITRELQSLIEENKANNTNITLTKNLIFSYFKKRAFSIVIIVIVLLLLVTTTLFTDMGLNIGAMLMKAFKSFVGI